MSNNCYFRIHHAIVASPQIKEIQKYRYLCIYTLQLCHCSAKRGNCVSFTHCSFNGTQIIFCYRKVLPGVPNPIQVPHMWFFLLGPDCRHTLAGAWALYPHFQFNLKANLLLCHGTLKTASDKMLTRNVWGKVRKNCIKICYIWSNMLFVAFLQILQIF